MSYGAAPVISDVVGGEYSRLARFAGGAAAVVDLVSVGFTVNYISTGVVDLVWQEYPGTYLGIIGYGFEADTPSGVAGFTVCAGAYNTTTRTLRLNINNGSNALADLTATQRLTVRIAFAMQNLTM
jgi:hypothetical protein